MKVSIMEDGRKILVYLSIVSILASLGCIAQKPSVSDFSISNFNYDTLDATDGRIIAVSSVIVTSSKEGLYARVYDIIHNVEIAGDWSKSLTVGDNKIEIYTDLYLDSLRQAPEIEICVSNKRDFNRGSKGVVCKIEIFPPPVVKFEVSPVPVILSGSIS